MGQQDQGRDDGATVLGRGSASQQGARRVVLVAAAALTVALGLGIRTFVEAGWAGPAGDALYAVMVYLAVALLVPSRSRWVVAVVAYALCAAIELFQATGVPAELGQLWPPVRLVLGTTFVPQDLLAYAAGVALAVAGDAALGAALHGRRRPR